MYSWLRASLVKLLKKFRQFDHSILMDLLFVSDMKDRWTFSIQWSRISCASKQDGWIDLRGSRGDLEIFNKFTYKFFYLDYVFNPLNWTFYPFFSHSTWFFFPFYCPATMFWLDFEMSSRGRSFHRSTRVTKTFIGESEIVLSPFWLIKLKEYYKVKKLWMTPSRTIRWVNNWSQCHTLWYGHNKFR